MTSYPPCVGSGMCCKRAPCGYGEWNKDKTACAYLEEAYKGEATIYKCGRYDYIIKQPGAEIMPASTPDAANHFSIQNVSEFFTSSPEELTKALLAILAAASREIPSSDHWQLIVGTARHIAVKDYGMTESQWDNMAGRLFEAIEKNRRQNFIVRTGFFA